jgi:hypothetical protein
MYIVQYTTKQHLLPVQTKHVQTNYTGPKPIWTKRFANLFLSGQNPIRVQNQIVGKTYWRTKPVDGKTSRDKTYRLG